MNEQMTKEIIDSTGRIISSRKNRGIKEHLKKDFWYALGTGSAMVAAIINILGMCISKGYASTCSSFYGIHSRYFDGNEMFEDKLSFFIVAMILFLYSFSFCFINIKIKSTVNAIFAFVLTVLVLFMQNVVYTSTLVEQIRWDFLKDIIDNNIAVFIFLIADIIIAFFIVIRKNFWKDKKLKKWETRILLMSLLIFFIDFAIGFTLMLQSNVRDKKTYEFLDYNKVIVSVYDGKFVTMNCEIEGGTLHISKGECAFHEIEDADIIYYRFKEVICE